MSFAKLAIVFSYILLNYLDGYTQVDIENYLNLSKLLIIKSGYSFAGI